MISIQGTLSTLRENHGHHSDGRLSGTIQAICNPCYGQGNLSNGSHLCLTRFRIICFVQFTDVDGLSPRLIGYRFHQKLVIIARIPVVHQRLSGP
jgi:hypothetical protein